MKILLFEWLVGGGLWIDQAFPDPNCSMQKQGLEMVCALLADLNAIGEEIEVLLPVDSRLSESFPSPRGISIHEISALDDLAVVLKELADVADAVLVIAPETESILIQCLAWLTPFSKKLVSPDIEFVRLTTNKYETCQYLSSRGFDRHPQGVMMPEYQSWEGWYGWGDRPLVFKPVDGAGSESMQLFDGSKVECKFERDPEIYLVEPFIEGTPVSVSVIANGSDFELLPPTRQLFDREPFGHYIGAGKLTQAIAERAVSIANDVVKLLPQTRGYFGLDLVISDQGPKEDCFLEVNPRLTSSYVALRKSVGDNLVLKMLSSLEG